MSYTSVYAVYKTKAITLKELGNSHLSAALLWEYLSQKYRGKEFCMWSESDAKDFWPIWKKPEVSYFERIVLASTYDMAIVDIELLEAYARACEKIYSIIGKGNHFQAIAAEARNLLKKHDYRCLGLGIGCTSVCDPWERDNSNGEQWSIKEALTENNLMPMSPELEEAP